MSWGVLSTREWAVVLLALALAVLASSFPVGRKGIRQTLKIVASRAILGMIAALILWLSFIVWIAAHLGFWNTGLLKNTVVWLVVSGFATIFAALRALDEEHFFRRAALTALGIIATLQFWLNLYTFTLWIEVFIQLFIGVAAAFIVAPKRPEGRYVRVFFQATAIVAVTISLAMTARGLARTWHGMDHGQTLRSFAFSVWLSLGVLPFVYVLALVLSYDVLLGRMTNPVFHHSSAPRARLAVFIGLRGSLRAVHDLAYSEGDLSTICTAASFRAAAEAVRIYKARHFRSLHEPKIAAARLARFAGQSGAGADGRILDQREVQETEEALRWVHTCQMGNYRNLGSYRNDLLDVIGSFERQGLPEDHGISMRVRKDGQAWYAWRRTPAGLVLAIGASGEPPDEWLYEGRTPPNIWPGSDPAWGDAPFNMPREWVEP